MKKSILKTAVISLGVFAIGAAAPLAIAQQAQMSNQMVQDSQILANHHEEADIDDMLYYLEDYKEGYRDGFMDGFQAALEELEGMYFDDEFGDMYDDEDWEEDWDEDVELLDTAPQGLSPSYLPEGLVFEEAYAFTDEDGFVDEGAFYVNEENDLYLDINRLNMTLEEATDLYGEDLMADLADLPTKNIAATVVYIETMTEEGEDYITAYFSTTDGLYTVDSNLSEAEMNVILSSLLEQQ